MIRKIGTALGPTIALAKDGVPIKEIVRRLDHSRQLVHQVTQGERQHISRTGRSSLDLLLPL
jgi:hypothetical protein